MSRGGAKAMKSVGGREVTKLQLKLIFLLLGSNVIVCILLGLSVTIIGQQEEIPSIVTDKSASPLPKAADSNLIAKEEQTEAWQHGIKPKPRSAPDPAACHPCSARAHGSLPTTLRRSLTSKSLALRCRWTSYHGESHDESAEANSAGERVLPNTWPKAAAKELCVELGDECAGLVCDEKDDEDTVCGLFGAPLPASNSQTTTLLKECGNLGLQCTETDSEEEGSPGGRGVGGRFYGSPWHTTGSALGLPSASKASTPALVVLAHNRRSDLEACLRSLVAQPDVELFQLYVSIDDAEAYAEMTGAAQSLLAQFGLTARYLLVLPRNTTGEGLNADQETWVLTWNLAKIGHHYWVVFERIFMDYAHSHAVFVEEDLVFAPDFLALFRSTAWLLEEDDSLWCVSGWNDNGFKTTVRDQCRLQRTSYFPGLGFLLPRKAWLHLRTMWPPAATMGWDYWFRVGFDEMKKECIIPEVSRSHHAGEHGSSINTEKQRQFFRSMALATLPNRCGNSLEYCDQFGDISYLLQAPYERWVKKAISTALPLHLSDLQAGITGSKAKDKSECKELQEDLGETSSANQCAALVSVTKGCSKYFQWSPQFTEWGCRCCKKKSEFSFHEHWNVYVVRKLSPDTDALTLSPDSTYLVPYVHREFQALATFAFARPSGSQHAIPQDIRTHHYGFLTGRHVTSRAELLLVDQRSPREYLTATNENIRPNPDWEIVVAPLGHACDETCQDQDMKCDASHLYFVNDCSTMKSYFPCKWCGHQVGLELPAFVADSSNMNFGQCLYSYISLPKCDTKHDHTQRLCTCVPA